MGIGVHLKLVLSVTGPEGVVAARATPEQGVHGLSHGVEEASVSKNGHVAPLVEPSTVGNRLLVVVILILGHLIVLVLVLGVGILKIVGLLRLILRVLLLVLCLKRVVSLSPSESVGLLTWLSNLVGVLIADSIAKLHPVLAVGIVVDEVVVAVEAVVDGGGVAFDAVDIAVEGDGDAAVLDLEGVVIAVDSRHDLRIPDQDHVVIAHHVEIGTLGLDSPARVIASDIHHYLYLKGE